MRKADDEVTISIPEGNIAISPSLSGNRNSCSTSINNEIVNVTGMDPKFYKAAVEGNMYAFKGKDEEIETMLTPNKNTILHIHLTAYNYSVSEAFVEEILDMCPTLLVKTNAKGETLLHIAARYGHSIIVKKLIESSAKALPSTENTLIRAIRDDTKDTALHEAVIFKHIEIVNILTKEDPHISNFVNGEGETPLYVAIEREYWDVAQKILDNCNSPSQDGPNGRTALHAAVIRNNKEMVSKLLTRTSVNQIDEYGWVPLHLAALRESTDLTEELLKYDRNTAYKRDKRGRTALHFAAHYGHVKVMEKIIEYCPDCTELVDENGYNALHYCAVEAIPYHANAVRMILDNTSLSNLYNEKDNNGNTPLHHLARNPDFDKDDFHYLLEIPDPRVDIMAFNGQNLTAVDVAYNNLHDAPSSKAKSLGNLVRKLGQIGSRYGGRITKDDKNKKQEEASPEHNSVAVETNKKPNGDNNIDPSAEKLRETNMVVAALIATVTFAAGFTMPGGFVQELDQHDKGSPILMHNPAFQAFVITDTFSFVLSTSAVLFQILASSLPENPSMSEVFVLIAFLLTMLAMVFMVIAFGTGTYAILGVSKALAVVTLLIILMFFFSFFLFCCASFKVEPMTEREKEGVKAIYPELDGPIFRAKRLTHIE